MWSFPSVTAPLRASGAIRSLGVCTCFIRLKILLIYFNPLKPSKPGSLLKRGSTEKIAGNPPPRDGRQEPAHSWEFHTSKCPMSPTSQPPTPIHPIPPTPHLPNPMLASDSWVYFSSLVSILPVLTSCVESQMTGCASSCPGHLRVEPLITLPC